MKTKEELNALKKEVENVSQKLAELSDDELKEVAGGQVYGFIPILIATTTTGIAASLQGNVATALQATVPGVNVVSEDSRPGASMTVRVRGTSSVTQSNDPLIIVDGMNIGTSDE